MNPRGKRIPVQRLPTHDQAPARVDLKIRRTIARIAVVDCFVIAASVTVAWQLRLYVTPWLSSARPELDLAAQAGPAVVTVWLLTLLLRGAYSIRVFGAGTDEYRSVIAASCTAAGLTGLVCYLTALDLSRGFVILAFGTGAPALILWRYAARLAVHRRRARGELMHRVIAVGGPAAIREIIDVLQRERNLGYEVVGACIPSGTDDHRVDLPVPVVGSVKSTRQACAAMGADTVLVARGGYESSADLRRIAWDLQGSRLELIVVPSLTEVAGPRIHMSPVAGLPLLHLQEPQVDEAGGYSKRIFDIAGACIALVIFAPVMLAVAAAIKLEDGGPMIFSQRRIGWNGREFRCFKYRSMTTDAELREAALRAAAGHVGALWKSASDPRVTKVGAFIRRYSLDELPQLFNVLSGSMSLVGPRPQQAWEVETYSESARRRLLVRPGMTGLWQVSGRSKLSFDEAVRLDLYYVDNWSLTTDLVIMAKTAKAVVTTSGAY